MTHHQPSSLSEHSRLSSHEPVIPGVPPMRAVETALLRSVVGDLSPELTVCTNTRMDAGHWLKRVPVWLCVMDDHLVVLAVGRRKFIQHIPLADCAESFYCHARGALVIAPGTQVNTPPLAMPPAVALQVIPYLTCDVHTPDSQH